MSSELSIRRVEGHDRHRAIGFIRDQFARHFDAEVHDDTQDVFAVVDGAGQIQAAFGLNRDPGRFFSRHYVGDVERTLTAAYPLRFGGRVVELAHLCVRQPMTLCRLIKPLAAFLWREADYLICTVTSELARFFKRKGLASHQATSACINKLPSLLRDGWGNYYDHRPIVVCGCLQDACETLRVADFHPQEVRQIA